MRLFEVMPAENDGTEFIDNMINAVSAAQLGFYFEEGGCWGMTLALYDELRRHGAQIIVGLDQDQEPIHSMIRMGDRWIDHQGFINPWTGPSVEVTPNELLMYADRAKCPIDDVQSDRALASEIIQNAKEM